MWWSALLINIFFVMILVKVQSFFKADWAAQKRAAVWSGLAVVPSVIWLFKAATYSAPRIRHNAESKGLKLVGVLVQWLWALLLPLSYHQASGGIIASGKICTMGEVFSRAAVQSLTYLPAGWVYYLGVKYWFLLAWVLFSFSRWQKHPNNSS